MKKRIFALLLALSILPVTALATETIGSTDNFIRTKTYAGEFHDLAEGSTFYNNVTALFEYGLTVGTSSNRYGLKDSMTVRQIVIFAARIRSLYRTGDPEAGAAAFLEEAPGTRSYLAYLQSEGVLGTEFDEILSTRATRAQVAHVLAAVLPEEALPRIHDALVTQCYASRRYITDVTEYTPYYQDILTLYRCGIVTGTDAAGTYRPNDPITRGAAAAMLTRMVDPALRKTPNWAMDDTHSAAGMTLADLIRPGVYIAAPANEPELDSSIRHMLASGSNTLSLRYPSLTTERAQTLASQSLEIIKRYCEQSYNSVSGSYSSSGSITLRFSAAGAGSNLEAYRTQTMEAAIAVHDQLWRDGLLTEEMTQQEKAEVYFDWVCDNTVYDYAADDASLSHIPYQLFTSGTAVCDGYTGAYNLLLKLEGIPCEALSGGENHIWTVATLDGVTVHIDTTWGDNGVLPDYRYFAMTPSQSYRYHPW